jgi:hypothetical protein
MMQRGRPSVPTEEDIATLTGMGFDRDQCVAAHLSLSPSLITALIRCVVWGVKKWIMAGASWRWR